MPSRYEDRFALKIKGDLSSYTFLIVLNLMYNSISKRMGLFYHGQTEVEVTPSV